MNTIYLLILASFPSLPSFAQEAKNSFKNYSDQVLVLKSKLSTSQPYLQTNNGTREEIWKKLSYGNEMEVITVSSSYNDYDYFELFLTKNGNLIYAEESILNFYNRPDDFFVWTCQYILENNSVIDYLSLGHGETEDDDWNPESIFKRWNDRKKTYLKK